MVPTVERRSRLAWSIALASIAGMVAAVVLGLVNQSDLQGSVSEDPFFTIGALTAFGAFSVMGGLISSRQPGNALGAVFLGVGGIVALGTVGGEYATYGFVTSPGSLPFPVLGAWIAQWWWFSLLGLVFVFTPLLFPTGSPPGPRWRWIGWVGGASMVIMSGLVGLQERLPGFHRPIDNPIGIPGLTRVEEGTIGTVLLVVFGVAMSAAVVSMVVRFRRSVGVERQQLKTFTFAAAVIPVVFLAGDFAPLPEELENLMFVLSVLALPVATGVAILRHGLYDIDLIIRRTLIYGLLTGLLVAVYSIVVLLLQNVLNPLTQGSQLAVAGSTLAVVALFGPLRARLQAFIDRRFYRSRYDAARAVEQFAGSLRHDLDLASIERDLMKAIGVTVHPSAVWLWIKADTEPAQR